ncbi:MAG: squalene/phytoene synthase family protein [Nitrococcus mobilis]|nr:squalene/phytoene synthase family protein [Nitrococcus mobilis]
MNTVELCRDKAAPRGSSLHYALLFTETDKRAALLALHAFYAEVTEIVAECRDHQVAAAKLAWWREELARIFEGCGNHPISQALHAPVQRYRLDRHYFEQILEGAQMDLEYNLYPSFRELSLYCHRLGCSIASLSVQVCGYRDRHVFDFAHDLGTALQLTRFLRNVRRYAAAGRCYIPEADMRDAGVDWSDLQRSTTSEPVRRLFTEQAERARRFYAQASQRLPPTERWSQRPALVLGELYRSLLEVMANDHFSLLERRYHLTPLHKLWLAWRTARAQPRSRRPS